MPCSHGCFSANVFQLKILNTVQFSCFDLVIKFFHVFALQVHTMNIL